MIDARAQPTRPGPELVSRSARNLGQRLMFEASHGGIHLQQYDLVPGSWRHEELSSWRIALQELGSCRIERTIESDRQSELRAAGKVSISPPNQQSWSWDSPMRVVLLFISHDVVDEVASDAGIKGIGELRTPLVADDNVLRYTALETLSECMASSRTSRLLIAAAGRHVAAHILSRYSRGNSGGYQTGLDRRKLKRTVDYIEENLGQDIGLEELSANCGMTPHYFCRAFRKAVGMPPYRYLIGRRIERSKELLSLTEMPITTIALEVGFSSHSHFSTAFRASAGCTPLNYRKRGLLLPE